MLLDLAFLAVGVGSLVACWHFVKVCERSVTMDYIISFLTAVGLFVYLLYALVRPERF